MENKQTAVEWLLDNLNFEPYDEEEFISNNKIWEQAKQMEKEQIKNAFDKGYSYYLFNGGGEQYYDDTYGN
jgi:hypothetical protein